jgi:membrane protein
MEKNVGRALKKSFTAWNDDDAFTLSAALSYYMIFSIAPLVLIAVTLSGLVWGQEASRGEIYTAIRSMLGKQGATTVQAFVQASSLNHASVVTTTVGVITLLIGATSVFAQLQTSLNDIWKVKRTPGKGLLDTLRQRALSFSLVLIIAVLLLVSLLVSAILTAVGDAALIQLPGGKLMWHAADVILSFAVTTVLFGAIYKILPDVKLIWRDVIWGAVGTALFFTIGKLLIGLYLGKTTVLSAYGAAGSFALILIWTYYSSCVLFFGAEFTKIHAGLHKLVLKDGAEWATSPEAQQKTINSA